MNNAQYLDPASERLGNGRSMSELMRRGPSGLRGVVVASSTPGGLPVNYNPHDRSGLEIHVEPDNGNTSLTLDKITAGAVDRALATAREQVQGNDINSIRERAAVAFEQLAKIANSGVRRMPAKKAAVKISNPAPEDEEAEIEETLDGLEAEAAALRAMDKPKTPPLEKIDRNYSPMAAFGMKKQTLQPTTTAPVVAKSGVAGPPQKLVYFEKEGIGTVPAFFHEVIVNVSRAEPDSPEESGFIVLVYDVRFEQSAARWFPPANDPYQRPWAVQISEDNRLYLVHTTGFQYIYDSREYCVLLVEKALRAPEGIDE